MENSPENFEESDGIELLQKCTNLEDIENVLQEKRCKPRYRYTKEQLLKLRTHPLSTKSPTLCDNLKFLCGKNATKSKDKEEFDSKKTSLKKHGALRPFDQINNEKLDSKKNGEKPSVSFRADKIEERKPTDPAASRLRKELDICLSPQRKSFNTGCYVPSAKNETIVINSSSSKQNLENNTVGNRENKEIKENRNAREIPRRIGSGRIITSDPQSVIRGYPENRQILKEKPTVVYKCTFRGKPTDKEKDVWDRPKNISHYDKRRYQYSDHHYDSEEPRDQVWDQSRNNNYYERRRHYNSEYQRDDDEEKEPEWMKDGPGSKNDMIELKGFDENVEKFFRGGRNKQNSRIFHKSDPGKPLQISNKSMVNGKDILKCNSESDNSSVASESTLTASNETTVETKKDEKQNSVGIETTEKNLTERNVIKQSETNSIEINLDEIFKEPLPDISASADVKESAGSKFTRWFKRDDSNPTANSVTDQNNHAGSNLAGSFHPLVNSTSNIKNVVSAASLENNSIPVSNLLDLLRGSQENAITAVKQDVRALVSGKLHSLEEIEAKLRGTDMSKQSAMNAIDRKKKEEETEAFKKLLSQAILPNDASKKLNENVNSNDLDYQKTKSENMPFRREKSMLSSLLCNGDTHSNFPPNMLPPQVSRMSPMNVGKQFQLPQQNKQQQEMLSKMLISSTGNYTIPPPTAVRAINSTLSSGTYSHMSIEIQNRVNDCQLTRELMQRPETMNILRALRNGDLTIHQLIEQYKKTTPSQLKFRESAICVLKIIQQTPYINSTPFMGSPVGMTFSVPPPPPHPSQPPYNENIIQQMMMNSQYRSGLPNIVYQRDFSSPNQNMYQSNINKKHPSEQTQNVNQTSIKMNSPITISAASISNLLGNNSVNVSASLPKSGANMTIKSSPASQSHSFTPLSVLRKLSAEKENLDTFSKESKSGDMVTVHSQSNTVNLQQSIASSGFVLPVSNTLSWNSSKPTTETATSSSNCGNQNVPTRSPFVNGLLSGDEQLNRLFSASNVNQSFSLTATTSSMSVQNIMSVEEIERIQQSVRN